MSRRQGFTLLEILLAIMIGMLLLAIAVPSVSGMLREQRLKATYEEFDEFVRKVQARAVKQGKTQVMVWKKEGISVATPDPANGGGPGETGHFAFPEGTLWNLTRPAALVKKPVWEWPFWRSGSCEPVIVTYESPAGSWSLEYDGLTGRAKLLNLEAK
jgi:prepilin-type N-terminal cleavage/methylation domain-containing protein